MHETTPIAKLDGEQADALERLIRQPVPTPEPNPMEVVGEIVRDYLLLLVRAARGANQVTLRGDSERRVLLLLVQRELGHWPEFDDVAFCLDAVMGAPVDLSPFCAAIVYDLAILAPNGRPPGLVSDVPVVP